MSDPIIQRISVEGVEEAVQGLGAVAAAQRKLEQASDGAAGKSHERTASLSDQRDALVELMRQELSYQSAANGSGGVDEAARQASTKRRAEIEAISNTLAREKMAQEAATQAVNAHVPAVEQSSSALGKFSEMISAMVLRWFTFTAIVATIVQGFKDIASAAEKAAQAAVEVGKATRGLSANLGGKVAKEVFDEATRVAGANKFDVAGRNELVAAAAAITDARPNMTRTQISEFLGQSATLQRATGVGGRANAEIIHSLSANLGVSDSRAMNIAATMLSSGIDPDTVQTLAERGGNAGGLDFMALMVAAKETGFNINRDSRSMGTLLGNLDASDPQGRISPNLTRAHVTKEMQPFERFRTLVNAKKNGTIREETYEAIVGGKEMAKIIQPLERALDSDAFLGVKTRLADDHAAANLIEKINQNPDTAITERQNLRDLVVQVRRERPSRSQKVGEAIADIEAENADVPQPFKSFANMTKVVPMINPDLGGTAEQAARFNQYEIVHGQEEYLRGQGPVIHIENFNHHGGDPRVLDSGRRDR